VTGARHRHAWLLSIAVAASGALAAHALAYRLVEPDAERRRHLLEETGHGYLDLKLFGAFLTAVALVGFIARVFAGGRRAGAPPLWLFALAPPLGFVLQEQAEHALHSNALSVDPLLAPTFLIGLLLQVPFALAALLAARTLLATADALAAGLGSPPRLAPAPDAGLALPVCFSVPAAPTLIGARGQRAPPHLPAL
jgi:hypothetical protein